MFQNFLGSQRYLTGVLPTRAVAVVWSLAPRLIEISQQSLNRMKSLLELFYSPSTFFVRAVVILTLFSFIFRSAGNERSNKEKGTILTCTIS